MTTTATVDVGNGDGMSECVSYFPHCGDQIRDKQNLGLLCLTVEGTAHHGREGVVAGAADPSAATASSREK